MNKFSFNEIREKNLLLYEFIKGSVSQHLNTETSDTDTGGVFLEPLEQILGLGFDFQTEISDEKQDTKWFGLTKYLNLLSVANPLALESLFVDDDMILYMHPLFKEIRDNRKFFITKKCFDSFFGYARSQIKKCRGLNKKIVNPVYERLTPLDFTYTFYQQGSTCIKNWLEYRGLKQKYCGLVAIPNCHNTYGLYYDFGKHFQEEHLTLEDMRISYLRNNDVKELSKADSLYKFMKFIYEHEKGCCNKIELCYEYLKNTEPIGFRGMWNEEKDGNELRLSSIPKGMTCLCHVVYNQYGYTKHCSDYKSYQDWLKHRNPQRYLDNTKANKGYDLKNVAHCVRMIDMAIEIANEGTIYVNREGRDKDLLMDIKLGKIDYDTVIKILDEKEQEMKNAIANTKVKDDIDIQAFNSFVIALKKKFYNI